MRRSRMLAAGVASIAVASVHASQACEPPLIGEASGVLRTPGRVVAYRTEPRTIAVGAHFAVELAVCATEGAGPVESLAVDADMPAHRHGMNYRASVTPLGGGRFRVEGLLFHMPGQWRLIVELRSGGSVEHLTDEIVVE